MATLDPVLAIDSSSKKIHPLLFRKLFTFKNSRLENDLVYKYRIENEILYLELKNSSLKSTDVKFSLDRVRKEVGPRNSLYKDILAIRIISSNKLEIRIKNLSEKYLELFCLINSEIYSKEEFEKNSKFISDGVYTLTEWSKNDFIHLDLRSPNPYYPHKLKFQILPQPSSAIYLYKKGLLDLIKIPYFLINESLLENSKVLSKKGLSLQYIAINHKNNCFDLPFRKALNLSVNREELIQKIFSNFASQVNTSIPDIFLEKYTEEKFRMNYDLNLAKEELNKSKCYPEILKTNLDFRMRADDENKSKSMVLAHYFKRMGLRIQIHPMEKTKLYKENHLGKGDLTLLTWYIDQESIENFIDPLFASDRLGNGGNRSFYINSELQREIEVFRKQKITKNSLKSIIQILLKEQPILFLWSVDEVYLLSSRISIYDSLVQELIQ
jgi:peptide/nickel transport system substrate-binding protein